jgi:hypothetical protein
MGFVGEGFSCNIGLNQVPLWMLEMRILSFWRRFSVPAAEDGREMMRYIRHSIHENSEEEVTLIPITRKFIHL